MQAVLQGCYDIMNLTISIEGFDFTLFEMMIFLTLFYVIMRFFYGVFE